MTEKEGVTIIIPVYNEAQALARFLEPLLEMAQQKNWDILIVDDGSTDDSSKIAGQFNIPVLKHPYNKGYGAALKTGIRAANSEVIVFMDADGQHRPEDIPRLLEHIPSYDMVVGQRYPKGQSLWRRPGKWLLGRIANYLSGMKIPDVNCGFRAVRRECAVEFLPLYPNGFSLSTTITLAMIKAGYSLKYIPIAVKFREGRKSTVKHGYDGGKTILLILRCITLFNPLKVFIPASLLLFTFGIAFTGYSLLLYRNVANSAIITILSSLIIFFFGILADQISVLRRSPDKN